MSDGMSDGMRCARSPPYCDMTHIYYRIVTR